MKKFLSLLILVGPVWIASTQALASLKCDDPLRDRFVCTNMFHLRTQVFMFGEQRDLMRVDYPLLSAVAQETQDLVTRLLTNGGHEHLANLETVRSLAVDIKSYSDERDSRALEKANLVQKQCLSCHQSFGDPSGNPSWDKISRYDWDYIVKTCNEPKPNRIPYLCKSMHGMFKMADFFWTAAEIPEINFTAVSQVAQELKRVATDLNEKGMVHLPGPGNGLFNEVIENANQVIALADAKDTLVVARMKNITTGCQKCHSGYR